MDLLALWADEKLEKLVAVLPWGTGLPDLNELFLCGTPDDYNECPECKGEGKVECRNCDGRGECVCWNCEDEHPCGRCEGEGTVTCPTCDGEAGEGCTANLYATRLVWVPEEIGRTLLAPRGTPEGYANEYVAGYYARGYVDGKPERMTQTVKERPHQIAA